MKLKIKKIYPQDKQKFTELSTKFFKFVSNIDKSKFTF